MPVRASLSTLKPGLQLSPARDTAGSKDSGGVGPTPDATSFTARIARPAGARLEPPLLMVDLGSGRDTR